MPVVQEELQVGKRAVSNGGVRVVQRVTETPVKEMIRLRDERATIERRPVDRPPAKPTSRTSRKARSRFAKRPKSRSSRRPHGSSRKSSSARKCRSGPKPLPIRCAAPMSRSNDSGAETTRRSADTTTATGAVTGGSIRQQAESWRDRTRWRTGDSMSERDSNGRTRRVGRSRVA
jgi:hypothetical protein